MSLKVPLAFDKYLVYSDLTAYLKSAAEAYPGLIALEDAGRSYEGREIWAVTVTNFATGHPDSKPAIYVDANIHAGEVTGSMVALYLIDYLTNRFGEDDEVTHLLDTRTFYILPRVNPDGAELYLTTPAMLRSSVRPWPGVSGDFEESPGLKGADLDGDGRRLQMRVRDDNKGEWKVSREDSRLMIPRQPGERGGPFYRLYPEGFVKDYEGEPVEISKTPYGLDLNRNFPSNWDTKVPGGGDYPVAEPESRAIVEFITAHPNIGALQALHTFGGFFFRNPCQYPEEQMDPDDLRATIEIAMQGTLATGYPDVKSPNQATLTEWAYEHKGIIGYTTELWNRHSRAGVDLAEYQKATPRAKQEMELALLAWNDRELAGKGFVNWKPFDHPQLGEVEIGGWDVKFCVQNAPPAFLAQECHKNTKWMLRHAAALPELHITGLHVEDIEGSVKQVTAVVENYGYLPTNITNMAKSLGAVKKDTVELVLREGIRILGPAKQEVDFIEGYLNAGRDRPAKSAVRVKWMIKVFGSDTGGPDAEEAADRGSAARHRFRVIYKSQRGGTAEGVGEVVVG